MMKLLAGAAIAALSIAATSANAQTPPPPGVAQGTLPPPMVEPVRPVPRAPMIRENVQVRLMPDRTMTRDEVVHHVREMFQRFDTNHDGVVMRDEAQQAAAQFGGRGQRMLDRVFGPRSR